MYKAVSIKIVQSNGGIMLQTEIAGSFETPSVPRKNTLRYARSEQELAIAAKIIFDDYCEKEYFSKTPENYRLLRTELRNFTQCLAWRGEEPIATIGAIHTTRLPIDNILGDVLDKRFRSKGKKISEIGKFGSRGKYNGIVRLMSAGYQIAAERTDVVVIRVAAEEIELYNELAGFEPLHPRPLYDPSVNNNLTYGMYVETSVVKTARQSPFRARICIL